ncbi:hypothetical protein CFP56_013699, partial [Quercus suber]
IRRYHRIGIFSVILYVTRLAQRDCKAQSKGLLYHPIQNHPLRFMKLNRRENYSRFSSIVVEFFLYYCCTVTEFTRQNKYRYKPVNPSKLLHGPIYNRIALVTRSALLVTGEKEKTGHSPSRIELFDITHVQANGQAVNEPTQDALLLQESKQKSLESEHKQIEADVELKKEVKHLKSMLVQQAIQMVEQRRHFEKQQASQMAEQRAHYDNMMMQMLSYITSQLKEKTGHSPSRIELFDITHVQANGQAVNEPTQDALLLQESKQKSLESEHKQIEADVELKKEVKHLKSMLVQQAIQMVEQRRHFEKQQASQMAEQRAHYDNMMMQMLSYITSQLVQFSSDH